MVQTHFGCPDLCLTMFRESTDKNDINSILSFASDSLIYCRLLIAYTPSTVQIRMGQTSRMKPPFTWNNIHTSAHPPSNLFVSRIPHQKSIVTVPPTWFVFQQTSKRCSSPHRRHLKTRNQYQPLIASTNCKKTDTGSVASVLLLTRRTRCAAASCRLSADPCTPNASAIMQVLMQQEEL